jgi:Domain of unknown function (DUF5666)
MLRNLSLSSVHFVRSRQSNVVVAPLRRAPRSLRPLFFFFTLSLAVSAIVLGGCGSAMSTPVVPPPPPAPANVTVLLSSTANDKIVNFNLFLASITLADKAGNSVALYNNANALNPGSLGATEFMHLNGASEPLVAAVSVPQGTYAQATVTVGFCDFTNVFNPPTGGVETSTYAEGLCGQGTGNTTVNLPSPITINASPMALSLNLQVPQSYALNGMGASATYTISPVFTLTPVPISSQPTNEKNGKIAGIGAQITSLNATGNGFVAKTSDGFSLNVNADNSTVYQGIAGFSTLAVGTLVDIDLAIRPDASLLATRVEVDDIAAPAVVTGPFFQPLPPAGVFSTYPIEHEGCAFPGGSIPQCTAFFQYDGNTVFNSSGQLSNLQSLPFTPNFTSATIFAGQNLSVFSSGTQVSGKSYEIATTVALTPQTLTGMVTAVSNSNGFNIYTVALAPYDLIPTLQASQLPGNRLQNPNTVIVYADANTRLLNSASISTGSVLRFRGLLFNDNGTLRMDCAQVNDGVPE